MKTDLRTLALSAALLSSAVFAQPARPAGDENPWSAGGQYTASLDQSHNQWRLQPLNGQDVLVNTGACSTGAMVPAGVWLLVRDAQGRLELVAPSVTRLPAGSPDRVALRACDQASGRQLAVPQSLLDLLAANTGAIYVSN